ncbi:MAG: dipeptide ABC transporter ATP-binding protein [Alphaproteobacteria bacterium]|nr:dipeptide ABC transporter ATP-binding protein [Alphaproteobacteria bacterium]
MHPVLEIDRLNVSFDTPDGRVDAVKDISLAIAQGECLGVVGESGSGKSQTFLAAFGLTAENAIVSGAVKFRGQSVLGLSRKALDEFRGRKVSFVFQDPLTALTPHLTVAAQMGEVLAHHFKVRGEEARKRSLDWLERVRIPEAARRLRQYPHELSGGMRQRVMIAMAMMGDPELLVADEPTTALDATVQAQVLDLIDDLRRDTGAAVALITHDMGVIARMAQRVIVMRRGEIVEEGGVDAIFSTPKHEYTRMLLDAAPRIDEPPPALAPPEPGAPILEAKDVRVTFPVRVEEGVFGATKKLRAVDGVSFTLNAGETIGIVGESGCGKSTLARAVLKLLPQGRDAGAVTFLGRALSNADQRAIRESRKDLQIVFQDPLASLDPRMTVGGSIAEPLLSLRPDLDRAARNALVRETMADVGLDPGLINRYPHELSGGQNQRVGIARAIILKPKLIVCDEAVSALDVSIQAQIVALLIDLQKRMRLAMLFISHDLAVVRTLSHKVLVLYLGRAVEQGDASAVLADPVHPYTKALLAASLSPDPAAERQRERVRLVGDLPSPLDTRASLRFLKSKAIDDPDAEQYRPAMIEIAPGHWAAEFDPPTADAPADSGRPITAV